MMMVPEWMKRSPTSGNLPHNLENTKIVLSPSFLKAILRSHVHIWPTIISTTIIIINVNGRFIGIDYEGPIKYQTINTLLLQIAAKLHEVLIVISLGAIVSNIVRTELLSDDGLSFGLISSMLSFNNAIYFTSKEFYGSFKTNCRSGRRSRGIFITITLLFAGIIALLVGPSSASLLVPQDQYWNSATTTFYVNGSWTPSDLNEILPDIQRFCNISNSVELSICPGAGYLSLLNYWSRTNSTSFANQTIPTYSADLSGGRFRWPVNGRSLGMPTLNAISTPRFNGKVGFTDSTFVLQPPLGPATILHRLATDWWSVLTEKMNSRINQVNDRKIVSRMYSPITYIRCAPPQNLSASENVIKFPTINGRFNFGGPKNATVPFLNGTVTEKVRFDWFMLPDGFGAISLGAVFQSPWSEDGLSRVVLGCSLQSGYVKANINTDKYSFWTGWYTTGVDWGSRIPDYVPTAGKPLSPTNGRILFNDEWLTLLTPPIEVPNPANSSSISTIEAILESASVYKMPAAERPMTLTEQWQDLDQRGMGPTPLLESIIGSVIVDGLSRASSYKIFNTSGPSTEWPLGLYNPLPDMHSRLLSSKNIFEIPQGDPSEYTTLQANITISGLNYQKGLATYLAMAVLVAHMIMVLGHLIMLSYQKRTSKSWSSATEMIALAQNSDPAYKTLENTGGGIHRVQTMGAIAKIRVRPNPHQPGTVDHVELVFEDQAVRDEQDQSQSQSISMVHSAPVEVGTASLASGVSLVNPSWSDDQTNKSTPTANQVNGLSVSNPTPVATVGSGTSIVVDRVQIGRSYS